MNRGIKPIFAAVLLAVLLSGCSRFTFDPQDLYALPTLPAKYTELNLLITNILNSGAEYAAPSAGTNTQSVQLVDLDGDGREEAVACFRNINDEKPLKIHIFTAAEDSYWQTDVIEGSGTGISSIVYQDMDNDGRMELLVGWKTADLQVLEAYSLKGSGAEVLVRSNYVKYAVADLNQDQMQELVVIQADTLGEGVADYYTWQEDGSLASRSAARISITMAELSQQGRVSVGTLQEQLPALFVTGVADAAHMTTDILTVRDGELKNIVLSETTGRSSVITPYAPLYPSDINSDGLTELPWPVQRAVQEDAEPSFQRVDWYSYNSLGEDALVCSTYHNTEDKWYFRLPEEWLGQIWISRTATQDEAVTTFYILNENQEKAEIFLRLTAITGSNREYLAIKGDRFILSRQAEVIYTAELMEANSRWHYGLTADQVREAFSLIADEWIAE